MRRDRAVVPSDGTARGHGDTLVADSPSSGDAEVPHRRASESAHLLPGSGFGRWRQTRPFWAGGFLFLAAILTAWWSLAPIGQRLSTGIGHVSASVLAGILAVGAVLVWLAPARRRLVGVIALAIGLYCVVTAHLGGLVAALITLVGGAMALSWVAPHRLAQPAAELSEPGDGGASTAAATVAAAEPEQIMQTVAEPAPEPEPVVAAEPAPEPVAVVEPAPEPVVVVEPAPELVVAEPAPLPVPEAPRRPSPRRRAAASPAPVPEVPASEPALPAVPVVSVPPVPAVSVPPVPVVSVPAAPPSVQLPPLLPPPVPVKVKPTSVTAVKEPETPRSTDV